MNKNKLIKIIDVIFWGIILFSTISKVVKIEEFDTLIDMKLYHIILAAFLLNIISAFLEHFYLTAIYVGFRIAYKKHGKDRISKIDLKNDTYYRDIIEKISPSELSYIDDFTLDKKDIVANLLSLQLKNKIKISDKIEIVSNNTDGLSENEKYILENLKYGTLKEINMIEFQTKVINDCKEKDLLIEKSKIKKKKRNGCLISIFIYIGIWVCLNSSFSLLDKVNSDLIMLISATIIFLLMICTLIFPFIAFNYITAYAIMNATSPYVRSKKGNEINEKLEGLKKYIEDYSMMNEKENEEIVLWEDYMIYAVIFGVNKKIVEDVWEKIC